MQNSTTYDAVIIGAGHNGLVAACYLVQAGMRVLVLEKNNYIGGATLSAKVFPGVDARLSVYSYLVSLLPKKILRDLGIDFETRQRSVAAYTPVAGGRGLLISNVSEAATRESFVALTGDEREYQQYRALEEKVAIFARKVWPTLLSPLLTKQEMRSRFQSREEGRVWEYLVEQPLARLIEDHLRDDTARGTVFTDAKIGVLTHPDDATLLQNRTFLYHVIGQGTGEWRVPVGGMGALVDALVAKARGWGVEIKTGCAVNRVEPGKPCSGVYYVQGESEQAVQARCVLFNTSADIANRILPGTVDAPQVEGAVFKINMVLKRMPTMKDSSVSAREAFTGTLHLFEGYQQMKESYRNAVNGIPGDLLPGEMYCHSLTDPSIMGPALQEQGYQTLTLFGLDVPYHWFVADNAGMREAVLQKYLNAINHFIKEDIRDCLATDSDGKPCIETKSPLDLEQSIGLPQGNIFHGNLTWPFAEEVGKAGTWGVETAYENIYICGSSARRGGAVSGIPGHNAAMKILGQ